jgi:hypothetical protein
MHTFIIALAVIVVAAGAYVNASTGNHTLFDSEITVSTDDNVLSDESTQEEPTKTESPKVTNTDTPKPSVTIIPTKTPTNSQSAEISTYRYPDSTIVSQTSTKLLLESNAPDTKITDWYKSVIKSRGMNVTSFVTTQTNGNVLNKLAAESSTSSEHVEVEISKRESDDIVTITVLLK